ncbi:MAG: LysM peptidoglycan-binding domain-containing protein [Anaerolineae bacterium]|nr:LysM peptidoglycan-binding domain-containing protein [Anaerolineae bacterium]
MNKNFYVYISIIFIALALPPTPLRAAPPAPCTDTYIVQGTDSLSKIADKFLGNLKAFPAIVAATNQQHATDQSYAQITNPDRIEAGWKLCVPANQVAEALLSETAAVSPSPETPPIIAAAPYTLDDFVREFDFGSEVKPTWIYESPPALVKGDISAEFQEAKDRYGYRANYLWNEHLGNDYFLYSGIFSTPPPQVKLYKASWGTIMPRYRYPPNATLPTGLVTNQFGWRGPAIKLDKAPGTIRIACVGASTTVSGHSFPHSYPELLQHWLNLWAAENDYEVKFEVINAGREGISSNDIAAVVRYEILPMDVDYVIYYEGANQFDPRTVVSYPTEVTFGQPPEGVVPNLANVESNDKSLLDQLSEVSALAARARTLVEQFSMTGKEPPKPEQTFHLPAGQDEYQPNRANLGDTLALKRILGDLDTIKQELDDNEVEMLLGTFSWFAYDNMVLDPGRHRVLYGYLNRLYWPISYANMRRAADFQNRVFQMWAADNGVPIIDVAGQMPRQPDLFDDAIHNKPLGIRVRAWLNFEALVPLLKQRLDQGELPRKDRVFLTEHPYISTEFYTRELTVKQ